jgi:peptide/nickel transport system permease protein
MMSYVFRRLLYAFPLLLGINVLTFLLFFIVNTPDDMARMHLGQKHQTQEAISKWKNERGYGQPLFWDENAEGVGHLKNTIFYQKSLGLFVFQFGRSDDGRDIGSDISQRMWPSLAIALPSLILGLSLDITLAMIIVFFRSSYLEVSGVALAVALMSISTLFYIIGGQFVIGKLLQLAPISGYDSGVNSIRFLIMPIVIGSIAGVGSGIRWYRTLLLEEIERDYVRTARAKGISEFHVLLTHVLKNAMIPILTGVVVLLPLLFTGSLITESFFAIPGLGSYTIDAINQQDFAIVRSMVFLGSLLYMLGLLLTDLSYLLVDPRVKLGSR